VASSYSVQDFLFACLPSSPSASPHPHTSFASRPAYERISSLESSNPALPSTRLQPPLPAPSSAPAADVCDHTVLPHPRSPFLSYLLYATLNNDHNTWSLLQRFGGMLTPRPWNPPPLFETEGLLADMQCTRKQRMEQINVRRGSPITLFLKTQLTLLLK